MRKKEEEWKAEKDKTEENRGVGEKMGEKYEDKRGGI